MIPRHTRHLVSEAKGTTKRKIMFTIHVARYSTHRQHNI